MSPAEYQGKCDWVRSSPNGMRARSVRRALRAWERELVEQGTTVETRQATDRVRLGLTPWFVVYFCDRPGQPLGSRVRHHDSYCTGILDHPDEDVRQATEIEIEALPPCQWCG